MANRIWTAKRNETISTREVRQKCQNFIFPNSQTISWVSEPFRNVSEPKDVRLGKWKNHEQNLILSAVLTLFLSATLRFWHFQALRNRYTYYQPTYLQSHLICQHQKREVKFYTRCVCMCARTHTCTGLRQRFKVSSHQPRHNILYAYSLLRQSTAEKQACLFDFKIKMYLYECWWLGHTILVDTTMNINIVRTSIRKTLSRRELNLQHVAIIAGGQFPIQRQLFVGRRLDCASTQTTSD